MKNADIRYSNSNWKWRIWLLTLVVGLLGVVGTTAFAAGPTGHWCRNEGDKLVDVISITKQGELYKVQFREGWEKAVYSEGVGSWASSRLTSTIQSKKPSIVVHVVMEILEDNLSYRSYNLDGSFRWKGEYSRCSR